MGIVAGFLVQNTLKYLLKFGNVTHYLGYNALQDFFPTMNMKPNPNCDDLFCLKRQKEFEEIPKEINLDEYKEEVVHEDNDWGICVIDQAVDVVEDLEVAKGIKFSYSRNAQNTNDNSNDIQISTDTNLSLDELMQQMKNL